MSTQHRYQVNFRANTGRILTYEAQSPAYAATISIVTSAAETIVKPGTLTGAANVTISAGSSTTPPFVGDKVTFMFAADGTDRIVTFTTNMKSSGTLTVAANKFGTAVFIFDGANWLQLSAVATA